MREAAERQLAHAVDSVNIPELRGKDRFYRGKVRDTYVLGDGGILLVTTDRVSAFDHVLGTVPYKGAVLNGIATHFMDATADVCQNALRERIGGMAVVMEKLRVLPVEAIVRAYITGSAARDYFEKGLKTKSGIELAKYLREGKRSEQFTELLFTPSTKATSGHDEDISRDEAVEKGLVTAEQWVSMRDASLAVFRRGSQLAAERGLILVDTKFEYGVGGDGQIKLVDEVLTPDSSRYWIAATYPERYAAGEEPEGLSKEPLRQALIAAVAKRLGTDAKSIGGMLDKLPKQVFVEALDDALRVETAVRYVQLYEQVTGQRFDATVGDPREQIYRDLKKGGNIRGCFVPIIAGSGSDDAHVARIKAELEKRGIPHEHRICSAHRDPVRLATEVLADYEDSIEPVVYVTTAGMSNGLSATVAGNTRWPIIACPPNPKPEDPYGRDDIWSTLRSPPGVPVLAVLEPANVGAAVQRMFGLFDSELRGKAAAELMQSRDKGKKADGEKRN